MTRCISILLIFSLCLATHATQTNDTFSLVWLERALDDADFTGNADAKLDMFTNILARVPEEVWETYRYDAADGLFIVWSGLSWAYLYKAQTQYFDKGLSYGLRARARGYETGVAGTHPERFAALLCTIAAYYETAVFSDQELALIYYEEAWDTWPYFNDTMIHLWRRKNTHVFYDPAKAIPLALEVIYNAPFCNTLFYRNCGWHYVLLEQYREAFALWHRGLIDGEPHSWQSPTPERIIDYLEYATLEELEETRRLFRINAAKYPAWMDTIRHVTGWLRWEDHPHLQFEITLREAELRGYDESVTNMLTTAVERYRRPYYAEKLGDTNMVVRLYCNRFRRDVWWWAIGDYSRLPKVHALVMSGDITEETQEYYRQTLEHLESAHPRRAERLQPYLQPFAKEEKE